MRTQLNGKQRES